MEYKVRHFDHANLLGLLAAYQTQEVITLHVEMDLRPIWAFWRSDDELTQVHLARAHIVAIEVT